MSIEEQAEAIVMKKAEEIAYINSDKLTDRKLQRDYFELIKSFIIYGARLYQETLNELNYASKEKTCGKSR